MHASTTNEDKLITVNKYLTKLKKIADNGSNSTS